MAAIIATVTEWLESKLHVLSLIGIAVALVIGMGLAAQLKIVRLERDAALHDVDNLNASIKAKDARYNAVVKAYSQKTGDDHDRQEFQSSAKAETRAARGTNRDGPLAPVAIDALVRLRARQSATGESPSHP